MEEKKHREGKGGKYLEKDNVAFGGEEKRRKKKKENVCRNSYSPPAPSGFSEYIFHGPALVRLMSWIKS